MTTVVIMPGGFHPFHAGHAALYNSIRRAFPGAEVFVAATNDTSTRPFPFTVKEKLAKLAGVEPGHFVQVKSPFRAEEITAQFDPAQDQLIFVRSEKDATKPPQPGGVKKNGEPAYLQPFKGARKLEPFSKHAYMAYLPTVEFGPGMTSATEIRSAWPGMNDQQKEQLVMTLYPRTQGNAKLAATVRKMLDTAIVGEVTENQGWAATYNEARIFSPQSRVNVFYRPQHGNKDIQLARAVPQDLAQRVINSYVERHRTNYPPVRDTDFEMVPIGPEQYQRTTESDNQIAGTPAVGGMWAGYQKRENQPVAEKAKGKPRDPELIKAFQYIKQHYPTYAGDPELGMAKWIQRSLKHSEEQDLLQNKKIVDIAKKLDQITKALHSSKNESVSEDSDYIEEKWSEKYKRSINCANPKGFSQRAHCQGRRKK